MNEREQRVAQLREQGYLVVPAFVEPHAHLDKAFLAERVPNPTGDLMGAILAMEAAHASITFDDIVTRAERAARLMVANGVTAIRTHADVTASNGLTSARALIDVRDRLRALVDIQVVALADHPITGVAGSDHRALLRESIALGIDVVGGCPHLDNDPAGANDTFLAIAAEAQLPVDLHTDETLDPSRFALEHLAQRVIESGFPHGVTASHCVSLAMQSLATQQRVAELVARAGIGVIALPQTNLFLQGRDHQQAMPRAVTAIAALRCAGVRVGAGGDNLQDPFNPVGRADPLETAALMVVAGHLLPDDALASVSTVSRSILGLPDGDLVAIRADSVREAIAFATADRVVLRSAR